MKERPILFSGEMVRALLDGRKTQTRRAIKLKTGDTFDEHALKGAIQEWRPMYDKVARKVVGKTAAVIRCPYGQPGDRLWVREAHAFVPEPAYRRSTGIYQQTNPADDYQACVYRENFDRARSFPWRPSIHMPRWASRILLEVTDVRVERLQEISEADAKAEGLAEVSKDGQLFKFGIPDRDGLPGTDDLGWPWCRWKQDPRVAYHTLWESINGTGSWAANPWVWVVEFRVIEPGEVAV